jgi:hypothetical protein
VEKALYRPSPDVGAGSIGGLFDSVLALFEDSSTGTDSIPSLWIAGSDRRDSRSLLDVRNVALVGNFGSCA